MEAIIKKYFWLVGLIVVVLCAALAGNATSSYFEAEYLGDRAEPARVAKTVPKVRKHSAVGRSKFGQPLVERNMFCIDCVAEEPTKLDTPADDPDHVPKTSLPLRLVATSISEKEKQSFATIRNTDTDRQGAYWRADEIPEAGPIETISGLYVDFRNKGRLERLSLLDNDVRTSRRSSQPSPPPPPRKPGGEKSELMSAIDDGIKKIDDTHYEIDRALVDKLLANPMSVARGARVVPSIKNGKSNGFKLYAIRPSSIYSKLGFMNGDTVNAINGFDLTTPDKALEVYTKVKQASNLSVVVTRRGKSTNLDYNIR